MIPQLHLFSIQMFSQGHGTVVLFSGYKVYSRPRLTPAPKTNNEPGLTGEIYRPALFLPTKSTRRLLFETC